MTAVDTPLQLSTEWPITCGQNYKDLQHMHVPVKSEFQLQCGSFLHGILVVSCKCDVLESRVEVLS